MIDYMYWIVFANIRLPRTIAAIIRDLGLLHARLSYQPLLKILLGVPPSWNQSWCSFWRGISHYHIGTNAFMREGSMSLLHRLKIKRQCVVGYRFRENPP